MNTTPNLSLPYIMPAQAQKHVTHNEALAMLDALVQLSVLDRDLAVPPLEPRNGDRYIVVADAVGDWSGHGGKIAAWQDSAWMFLTPNPGWQAFVADEGQYLVWNGNEWAPTASSSVLQNLALLGLGTEADPANPFAAKLNNALWTAKHQAEGGDGDLRYTLNKESEGNVLSLLMQRGYSGRAEIGLVGDDDLSVRTSPDGSHWTEIFRGDRTAGEAVIGGLRVGRDMVQNLLPDSGRFNGNDNNAVFGGIAYDTPSYMFPINGCLFSGHSRFIHNNNDYGGSAGALDPEVKALVDKIRPANARRYGPEWYVMLLTQGENPTNVSMTVDGVLHGLAALNSFTALPKRFTVGYYVKARSGSAAIRLAGAQRAAIDGVEVPAGAGSPPLVLVASDGWKYVNLQSIPNQFGYSNEAFNLLGSANAEILLAMPRIAFGHVDFDQDLGVLMNGKMFG